MDFDEDGRLYVAEFPEYNEYAGHEAPRQGLHPPAGGHRRRRRLRQEHPLRRRRAAGAPPSACWDGGVYVGSAPDLLYLKDTDGDGKADVRRVVFTGFGRDRARRGDAELVPLGARQPLPRLDRASTAATSAGPTEPEAKTVSVRGYGLVFDPRGETFELTSGGGQHGMSMDDWGRTYVCGNSDPFHLRDVRQPLPRPQPVPAGSARRGQHRPGRQVHEAVPRQPGRAVAGAADAAAEPGARPGLRRGGHAVGLLHGRHRRDGLSRRRFPARVPRQPVRRRRGQQRRPSCPRRAGRRARVGQGRRAEGREFLASRDNCVPPGADGQRAGRLPLGHRHVPRADRGGRRSCRRRSSSTWMSPAASIAAGSGGSCPEGTSRTCPRLGKATTAELVALLEHPNGWHRDTASRLLYQRQDRAAIASLATAGRPARRRRWDERTPCPRWQGLGRLDPDLVLAALSDPEPHVREHALRLAEPFCKVDGSGSGPA